MKILYADDDHAMQVMVRLSLEKAGGHEVRICFSGAAALKEAPEFRPDVILLDLNMPGMDGSETMSALRNVASLGAVPVIFLTAQSRPEDHERLCRLGAAGVISKPFEPLQLSGLISSIIKPPDSNEPSEVSGGPSQTVQLRLAELKQKYRDGLEEKIRSIEAAWKTLCRDMDAYKGLARQVHSLSGSGSTFGFNEVSAAARSLELQLKHLESCTEPPGSEEIAALEPFFEHLRKTCTEAALSACGTDDATVSSVVRQEFSGGPVFIFGQPSGCGSDLPEQIGYFGYNVCFFSDTGELLEAMQKEQPGAVIAELPPAGSHADSIEKIGSICSEAGAGTPLVFISDDEDISVRLRLVRAGGEASFSKPLNMSKLIDKLDELTMQKVAEPYRVLILDDEPLLAARHELVLQQAGMLTAIVTDPLQALQQLADFRPELILMDVYMPGCSGLELAKIIRQKEAFISVPIVFLSAETDINKQLSAMSIGGDDFLTKPISPRHLISSVVSRAERYRVLRSLMVHDSLTGLLNHSRTKEQLETELARALRQQTPLSFALIDLDHFKAVNDTYGHYAGDQVLMSISRLLRQRLRKTDSIGRYGGEEFAVILPGIGDTAAARVLNEIREDFGKILHQGKGASFPVTFSCGVAALGGSCSTPVELSEAADEALYCAKKNGRNRLVISGQ